MGIPFRNRRLRSWKASKITFCVCYASLDPLGRVSNKKEPAIWVLRKSPRVAPRKGRDNWRRCFWHWTRLLQILRSWKRPGKWKNCRYFTSGGASEKWCTDSGSETRRLPVQVGSLSHYLQGFIHPRGCRIFSINSSDMLMKVSQIEWFQYIPTIKWKPKSNKNHCCWCFDFRVVNDGQLRFACFGCVFFVPCGGQKFGESSGFSGECLAQTRHWRSKSHISPK